MSTLPTDPQHAGMRNYLYGLVEKGAFRDMPGIENTILVALQSSNPGWIPRIFNWLKTQNISFPAAEPEQKMEPLFQEPEPGKLRGDIFVGHSIPSGYPVHIPIQFFGGRGHVEAAGTTGAGKSTLLNFITRQLSELVPVFVYDVQDQFAPVLLGSIPPEKMRFIRYKDYRRNFLLGPPGLSQVEWLDFAHDHLMESLGLEPITANVLVETCEKLLKSGRVADVRSVTELLREDSGTQSRKALLNRFLPLSRQEAFGCPAGLDIGQLLEKSFLFYLKEAHSGIKRLIYFDHYFYYLKTRPAVTPWRLKSAFVFHEARELTAKSNIGSNPNPIADPVVLHMATQARNYGVALLFATQTPQAAHEAVRATIGTRFVFRLEDSAGVEMFSTSMALNERHRHAIMNLPERVMVVKRPDIPYPFLVRVPDLFQS